MRYDWMIYTKEYVNGAYESIAEYIRWAEERKDKFGETERPGKEMVRRASTKLKWTALKAKRNEKMVQNIVSGSIDEITKKQIEEVVKQKSTVNKALLKILVHLANHPEQMSILNIENVNTKFHIR